MVPNIRRHDTKVVNLSDFCERTRNFGLFDSGRGRFLGFEGLVERGLADFHARGSFANIEAGSQMLAGFGGLCCKNREA